MTTLSRRMFIGGLFVGVFTKMLAAAGGRNYAVFAPNEPGRVLNYPSAPYSPYDAKNHTPVVYDFRQNVYQYYSYENAKALVESERGVAERWCMVKMLNGPENPSPSVQGGFRSATIRRGVSGATGSYSAAQRAVPRFAC